MAANAPGVLGALFDAADTSNALGALCTGIGFGLDSIYGPPPSDLKVAGTTVPVAHIGVTPPYVAAQACGFAGKVPTFAINGTGSPIADGAVMTPGSGVNRSGKACLVGAGVYAVDPATNLLQKTEAFDNVFWGKSSATVTANAATAPGGAATADKLVEAAAGPTNHYVFTAASIAATLGGIYTFSIYAKAAERSALTLHLADFAAGGNRFQCDANLVAGTLSLVKAGTFTGAPAGSIAPVGDGWYRITLSGPVAASALQIKALLNTGATAAYTGDGVSGLYVWGAQLEQAGGANPYVAVP